jgi:hypothetical protein
MDLKKVIRTALKVIIPFAFGVFFLWFLYGKMNLNEIWSVIRKGVRYDIILFSLIFGLGANITRGLRWKLLINSLGEKVSTANAVNAVLGTYAVNLLLPRVGEIWRCGVITKYDKVPFTQLFGTLLVDRVSDAIMVGLITASIILFNLNFFEDFFAMNPAVLSGIQSMINSVWLYATIIILIICVWAAFRYLDNLTIVRKAKELLNNVWTGIKSIWFLKKKWLFILETIAIWLGYFLYFYVTFYAFDFTRDLGVSIGLITFTMSSIAVAVPVQAGMGPWHFMVIATLVCFGVDKTDAAAFALVVHTSQTAWIGLTGLFGVIALPLTNKSKPKDKKTE